jgi:hypothetical protein
LKTIRAEGRADPHRLPQGIRRRPPCAEYAGAVGADKYDFVEKKAADWLMKNIQDSWVVWM